MEQLAGDPLNDSDSDDQDYVPPEGEVDEVPEEINSDPDDNSEDEELQKKRTDALWADFMADVEPASKKPKLATAKVDIEAAAAASAEVGAKSKAEPSATVKQADNEGNDTVEAECKSKTKQDEEASSGDANDRRADCQTDTPGTSSGKMKITQILDFAGEKIEVEKEVAVGSKEAKKLLAEQEKQKQESDKQTLLVRPKVGGGLSTVVGSILNKKNKMSVLEKSKLDWNGFKRQEGIEEELATFNRGKGGYLEKMAFLERADLRQFDIEKAMRERRRNR